MSDNTLKRITQVLDQIGFTVYDIPKCAVQFKQEAQGPDPSPMKCFLEITKNLSKAVIKQAGWSTPLGKGYGATFEQTEPPSLKNAL